MWDLLKWPICDSRQLSILPHWCFSIKHKKVFFKTHGKSQKNQFQRQYYIDINTARYLAILEIGFLRIPVGLKKTFLCLMLKHQCDNVISCLELWFGHFTSSHPPRFRSTSVLFYLIKWQKCCFRGPIQMLFSVPGACLMAQMAQFTSEIYLRT